MRPVIAVVGKRSGRADSIRVPVYAAGQPYLDAIRRAGGTPVVLAPTMAGEADLDVLDRVEGLLLLGGGDVDPARYGQAPHETLYGLDAVHDDSDLVYLAAAIERDLPVLAICRGFQVLNVARGGTLLQHIGEEHRDVMHPVDLEAGSRVAAAFGVSSPVGHSFHHQAVDQVGDGLVVTGRSPDGYVEALELEGATWVVGVQWHPEDTAADDPVQQRVFEQLVRQALAAVTADVGG